MAEDWRKAARSEVAAIKERWADKYGWAPAVEETDGRLDLYVTLRREQAPDREYMLRLRYEADFQTAGRREQFVDPQNRADAGKPYWPQGVRGFKPNRNPPAICLEGTFGFHSDLHRDRDGRRANINKLLLEVQQCMNA